MKRKKIVSMFYRQLAMLLDSGYTLLRALNILAERESNRPFAALIRRVVADIEKGNTFWEALQVERRYFTPVHIQLIRVGETAGRLVIVLNRLALAGSREVNIRNRILTTLAYPMAVLAIAVVLIGFLTTTVVPIFEGLYKDVNATLPAPTRLLVNISWMIQHRWVFLLLMVAILVFLVRMLMRVPRLRYLVDWLKMRVGFFGPLTKEYVVVSTCQTLSMLIESGINIVTSLELTRDASANRVVAEGLEQARREVDAGRGLEAPLRQNQIFPPLVVDMLATGQETGTLDRNLSRAAEIYGEELDNKLRLLASLIEPILVVLVGGVVMFVVLSLFLPYIRLINLMSAD